MAKTYVCLQCGNRRKTKFPIVGFGWNDDGEKPDKVRACPECGSFEWDVEYD